jgi:anti-anti-sigma regulatory factor
MAKYPHRIFEMYEFRDEAIQALTPKTESNVTEANEQQSWTFKHLAVSRPAVVTLVTFKEATEFGDATMSDFRDDLTRLADMLEKNSQVLFDFTGVVLFSAAAVNALVQCKQRLRNRGSRLALCSLAPTVRESFFAAT